MKIKKILQSKKYTDLFVVILEDETSFYIDSEGLFQHKLKKAEDITEPNLLDLKSQSNFILYFYKAKIKAYTRPSTARQIKTYLQRSLQKNRDLYPEQIQKLIEEILSKLISLNIINEEEYAKHKIDILSRTRKNIGINKIRSDLIKDGLSEKIIQQITSQIDEDKQMQNAQDETEKYLRKISKSKSDQKQSYNKAYRHLLYKGFSFNHAKIAVDTILPQFYNDDS